MIIAKDLVLLRDFTSSDSFRRLYELWSSGKPPMPVGEKSKGLSDKQIDLILGQRDGWEMAIQFLLDLRNAEPQIGDDQDYLAFESLDDSLKTKRKSK